MSHKLLISKKIHEIYNNSYRLLDTCSFSLFSTNDNYVEALINLKDFEYPVIAHLDLNNDEYYDNYNNLLRAKQLNYQSYIDSLFNDKTIAWMSINEDYNSIYDKVIKYVDLNIIMNKKHLNNKYILKYNIKQMLYKYMSRLPDYKFELKIYFADEIDYLKINDYYYLLSEEFLCDSNLYTEIDKSKLQLVSIYVTNNTNIDLEIEDSLKKITNFSNK